MNRMLFSARLFMRIDRLDNDDIAPIYLRIRLNKEKAEVSTGVKVTPESWDAHKECVIKHPDAVSYNNVLNALKSKVTRLYTQLYVSEQEVTMKSIKKLLLGERVDTVYTLIATATEHNDNFKSLVGIKYSAGSYKNYKTTLKYLKEFVPKYTNGKSDILLKEINYRFCEAYFLFVTTVKNCHVNGANKQLQRLRKILNYGIRHGYIDQNPMKNFLLKFEPVKKTALTLVEVELIRNFKFEKVAIAKVRDVFILQCYTGLSYSDICRLARKHIVKQPDGSEWIKMSRQKTKVEFTVPMLAPARKIIEAYSSGKTAEDLIMPVVSNQKMNKSLKVIQDVVGITKPLTTHLGRHTFATALTLSNGVPIETVSLMLGHTKLSTTQVYAKVLDKKIAEDMEKLSNRLRDGEE